MLVDANLLLFAVFERAGCHGLAKRWLTDTLNGPVRTGLPWISLSAFLRISTNPRATHPPLSPEEAWSVVGGWLAVPSVWVPGPTERHAEVLRGLMLRHQVGANMVTDAQLAALAVEHGLTMCSADTDFARFDEIRWENPVAP